MKIVKNISRLSGWEELEYKRYTLQLKAKASDYIDSPLSDGVTYVKQHKLDAPTNLSLFGFVLTFTTVQSATEYYIYIDGNLFDSCQTSPVDLSALTDFEKLLPGTHSVFLVAHADNYNNSDNSSAVSFYITPQLSAPYNLSISGNNLIFTKIIGAENYSIYINDNLFATVLATSGPSSTETIDLTSLAGYASLASGSYIIKASASATGYANSALSRGVIYKKLYQLDAPTIISIDNNLLVFTQVENATNYKIYVDGSLYGQSAGEYYVSNNVWVIRQKPTLDVNINESLVFKSNNVEYGTFIVNNSTSICYGTNANVVYNNASSTWANDAYKLVWFEDSMSSALLDWFSENNATQLSIDLSTFSGFSSLVGDSHMVNIVAESYGYTNSNHSANYLWKEWTVLTAPSIYLDNTNPNLLCITDTDQYTESYNIYESSNVFETINRGDKYIDPNGYQLTYDGFSHTYMHVYANNVEMSLPESSSAIVRTLNGVSELRWVFDSSSGWNSISINNEIVYEQYGAGSYTLELENNTTITFGSGGSVSFEAIQTSFDLTTLHLSTGTHVLRVKSIAEDCEDSVFSNSVSYHAVNPVGE